MLKKAAENKIDLPKLYVCCGTEDFAYPGSRDFGALGKELGVDMTYVEGPGVHNWDFWDPYIRKILDWLPLTNGFVD